MKRFFVRFLLGALGAWIAAVIVPGISTDGSWRTFLLLGFFIAVGEVILYVLQGGAAIMFFLIPRPLRHFGLRMIIVAIAVGLVSGFDFILPIRSQLTGLAGTTLIYTLLFLLPISS